MRALSLRRVSLARESSWDADEGLLRRAVCSCWVRFWSSLSAMVEVEEGGEAEDEGEGWWGGAAEVDGASIGAAADERWRCGGEDGDGWMGGSLGDCGGVGGC